MDITRRTSGRVLELAHPKSVFETWSIRPIRARQPFWEDLIARALPRFLVDVAVRRIAVTPAEVAARVRRFVRELAGTRCDAQVVGTREALRGVKVRVQVEGETSDTALVKNERSVPAGDAASPVEPDPRLNPPTTSGSSMPTSNAPADAANAAAASKEKYTRRLLHAKRRARGHSDRGGGQ